MSSPAEVRRLEAELSATQQKLEAAEDAARLLKIDNILSKERAEAAEARIKASQGQEPVGYRCEWPHTGGDNYAPGVHILLIETGTEDGDKDYAIAVQDGYKLEPLYAAPVIPPDVAELQRKLNDSETLRRQYFAQMCDVIEKNAELTRKLAAYQAVDMIMRLDCADDPIVQQTPEPSYAELTKLISEAKRKAVPEGWQLVPIKPTTSMLIAGADIQRRRDRDDDTLAAHYKAMLAAAPQPETDRGSNETCEEN